MYCIRLLKMKIRYLKEIFEMFWNEMKVLINGSILVSKKIFGPVLNQ